MKMKRKIILTLAALVAVLLGVWVYGTWFGVTRVAFVNFQTISMGSIAKANDNPMVKVYEVGTDELDGLTGYDMVFVNGMGLGIVAGQRAQIQHAAERGVPVYTNDGDESRQQYLQYGSLHVAKLAAYLGGGGRRNYRNMLNYIRQEIDGKIGHTTRRGRAGGTGFRYPVPCGRAESGRGSGVFDRGGL